MQEGEWEETMQNLKGRPSLPVHAAPKVPSLKMVSHPFGL
ncbi:hypothetical protein ATPR_2320 [Acetobacter tropicalis NBRC 101654]|uniref:Uncharacterized protein n=1 Tax=Acetobacter tropicalis NBRC 101654 TaxID=749388 RepID=F7VG21_9PROT|nr:hypothetical protein ATPR_2320 [Acetobacter tropicalis NBRC 101654]